MSDIHEDFLRIAIEEARLAAAADEVPVGAIIVRDGKILARGHNLRESLRDPTAHAEMIAIVSAARAIGSWRLDECHLYVTLEPCPMCAGAIVQARIPLIVFGAFDPKAGACGSLFTITQDPRLNHRAATFGGVLAEEAGRLLSEFFASQRAKGKK